MPKKYGGVNSKKSIGDIEEAVVYDKPPVHFTKPQVFRASLFLVAKIIPLVFAILLVTWGIIYVCVRLTSV